MRNERILIVEDNAVITFSYIALLQSIGFEKIKHISKGSEVSGMVNQFNPDLILMNILLADDVSGIDAAEAIRENYQTPIIFVSGLSDSEHSISNAHHFTKPLDFNLLSETIIKVLGKA